MTCQSCIVACVYVATRKFSLTLVCTNGMHVRNVKLERMRCASLGIGIGIGWHWQALFGVCMTCLSCNSMLLYYIDTTNIEWPNLADINGPHGGTTWFCDFGHTRLFQMAVMWPTVVGLPLPVLWPLCGCDFFSIDTCCGHALGFYINYTLLYFTLLPGCMIRMAHTY